MCTGCQFGPQHSKHQDLLSSRATHTLPQTYHTQGKGGHTHQSEVTLSIVWGNRSPREIPVSHGDMNSLQAFSVSEDPLPPLTTGATIPLFLGGLRTQPIHQVPSFQSLNPLTPLNWRPTPPSFVSDAFISMVVRNEARELGSSPAQPKLPASSQNL